MRVVDHHLKLPFSVMEFARGLQFSIDQTVDMYKDDGGTDGTVQVLQREANCTHPSLGKASRTLTRYDLSHRIPKWLLPLCPKLQLLEETFCAYPSVISEVKVVGFNSVNIRVETVHYEETEDTETMVSEGAPSNVERRFINVCGLSSIGRQEYTEEMDPCVVKIAGRGPMRDGWDRQPGTPQMTIKKRVQAHVPYPLIQRAAEALVHTSLNRTFALTYRNAYMSAPMWLHNPDSRHVERIEKRERCSSGHVAKVHPRDSMGHDSSRSPAAWWSWSAMNSRRFSPHENLALLSTFC